MSPHPRIQATRWVERAGALAEAAQVAARKRVSPAPVSSPAPTLLAPPAALPEVLPEQLWLALYLPQIEFAACYAARMDAGSAVAAECGVASSPRVVIDREARPPRVLTACAVARGRGIEPGMPLAAALAIARDLIAQPRSVRRERHLLETLAGSGFGLTSWVSLEPPDAVLLEVRGSLRLFGGAADLLAAARERGGAATGVMPLAALAPTPLAALVLARSLAQQDVDAAAVQVDPALLVSRLAPLPLGLLRWPPDLLERLATMGVRSIGEALRLPRAGFARRFGKAQLLALEKITGRVREPRVAFVPRERFVARCEPAYELTDATAVLRAAEPLLAQLEGFLRQRQIGISLLALALQHRPPSGALRGEGVLTRINVRLAAPELAAARFSSLLAERLAQTALPAPVIQLELRTGVGTPFAPGAESLWRPGEYGGAAGSEAPAFLERLRARLGAEAVYGLCLLPAHRPEAAWGIAEPQPPATALSEAARSASERCVTAYSAPGTRLQYHSRPLWLLRTPEPLSLDDAALPAAGLHLLAGPERIETGWWDGNEVLRDYYIARDAAGAELWLYRERAAPHRWFLQGLFG